MIFLYDQWDEFCRKLKEKNLISIPAATVLSKRKSSEQLTTRFIMLKHDVETNPGKALALARIENKHSHKGSYYVQAYLLHNAKNIEILKQIQELGHEVSYHHDVMDSNKGNIHKASVEFQKNIEMFEKNGFSVETVCQHGNPIVGRVGYSSNRDFFRDCNIANRYSHITEMMVNFKSKMGADYLYISDAGYGWKIIFDPENNDIEKSEDKDISLINLDDVMKRMEDGSSVIISTHPHRWNSNAFEAIVAEFLFISIKKVAKCALKIPIMKKFMGRYYYFAKKI